MNYLRKMEAEWLGEIKTVYTPSKIDVKPINLPITVLDKLADHLQEKVNNVYAEHAKRITGSELRKTEKTLETLRKRTAERLAELSLEENTEQFDDKYMYIECGFDLNKTPEGHLRVDFEHRDEKCHIILVAVKDSEGSISFKGLSSEPKIDLKELNEAIIKCSIKDIVRAFKKRL